MDKNHFLDTTVGVFAAAIFTIPVDASRYTATGRTATATGATDATAASVAVWRQQSVWQCLTINNRASHKQAAKSLFMACQF